MYEVTYQPSNGEEKATVVNVDDWHQGELVVKNVGTYKQFLISVVTLNDMGRSHAAPETKTVYSGEDSECTEKFTAHFSTDEHIRD